MKTSSRKKKVAKRVLKLPDLDFAKRAVLNTLGSPESKRAYEFAIDDFVAWYCSEPRLEHSARRSYCDIGSTLRGDAFPRQRSTCDWRQCGGWPMRPPIPGSSAPNSLPASRV